MNGPVAWTAHADLAEAAVRLFADESQIDGPTPPLTAAAAQDMTDIAAILSARIERPKKRKVVTDDEEERRLRIREVPAAAIEIMLSL